MVVKIRADLTRFDHWGRRTNGVGTEHQDPRSMAERSDEHAPRGAHVRRTAR